MEGNNYKLKMEYNNQYDNPNFNRRFLGSIQCGLTANVIKDGWYSDRLNGSDDKQLKWIAQMSEEKAGGKLAKWAIKAKKKWPWINGYTTQWWLTLGYVSEQLLSSHWIKGKSKICLNYSTELLFKVMEYQVPVLVCTYKLGLKKKLKGGHYLLITGYNYDDDTFYITDPAGNWMDYKNDKNGASVPIEKDTLLNSMNKYNKVIFKKKHKPGNVSFMYYDMESMNE